MKKTVFSLALLLATLAPPALACRPGDTSKTLLIVKSTSAGEENAVIANVDSDGEVEIERVDYFLTQKLARQIVIRSDEGISYTFRLANARWAGSYCYPVVFAN